MSAINLSEEEKELAINAIICQLSYIKGEIGRRPKFDNQGNIIPKKLTTDQMRMVVKLEDLLHKLQKHDFPGQGKGFVAT